MRIDEERLDNVPSYSACSGGGASVTSLWAGLRATPIICARMTIGKIAPRGQWWRGARHGAAGQHGSYRHIHITTQHIVHATGDSDYRRKFGIWVGGNMCLIIMKSQGFLYITLVVSSCNMQYRIRNASAWSKVGFISMYIVQYCECHKFLLIFIIIRINFCSD